MKLKLHHSALVLAAAGLLAATGAASAPGAATGQEAGADEIISSAALHRHIAVLASDEFEGRFPGTVGETRTLAYLAAGFAAAGARPGLGDSFLQPVPLVSWTPEPAPQLRLAGRDDAFEPAYREDMVIWTRRLEPAIALDATPVVFAGYGIVAPEYGWDDYAGLDVRGKTVVVLVNDPGFATGDPALFTGRAMTYYGRWTYKFEEAARQGAAALLIVHETEPASYGWPVVAQMAGEGFGLRSADGNASRVAVEGWISTAAATRLFASAGEEFEALKAAAMMRGFRPRTLEGVTASLQVDSKIRELDSHNVVAVIPGSERPDEFVVYTAHWDHLGRDGEEIFNGAVDNASGTAGLLVLAEAWAALEPAPARSVVFIAVTAEEQGLLGSAHYAARPVFPLERTVAVINIDVLNYIGPTRDITIVGYGASELDDFVDAVAARHQREVLPDQRPEAGVYYRSDHFSLAKRGVPAVYPNMGRDLLVGGREEGLARARQFNAEHYHKSSDAYSPGQDWSGGAADLRLYFDLGREVAGSATWPNWRPGNEFRALRDAQRPGG